MIKLIRIFHNWLHNNNEYTPEMFLFDMILGICIIFFIIVFQTDRVIYGLQTFLDFLENGHKKFNKLGKKKQDPDEDPKEDDQ